MNKKQVQAGMNFEMVSEKYKKDNDLFYYDTVDNFNFSQVKIPTVGDILLTTSDVYTKDRGGPSIDWKNTRTGETGTSFWQSFKRDTKYVNSTSQGLSTSTAPKKIAPIEITSLGPFNGFDIFVEKFFTETYSYSYATIKIKFDGTFTGGKKITTKMIADIKKATGFRDKLCDLLTNEIDRTELKALFGPPPTPSSYDYHRIGTAYYAGGNIDFTFLLQDDPITTKDNVIEFVDSWMNQKNSSYTHAF